MLRTNQIVTINGTSIIVSENGDELSVASMSASIDENGMISTNSNVYNKEAYEEHKEDVVADIQEFNKVVYKVNN